MIGQLLQPRSGDAAGTREASVWRCRVACAEVWLDMHMYMHMHMCMCMYMSVTS